MHPDDARDRLAALRSRLGARAAGTWSVEDGRLALIAFSPSPDLPTEVALGFEAATRSVDLARVDLGIVRAAMTGRVAVSVAAELPADAGSGHWLRAFGASRSVAVPIVRLGRVVSVALDTDPDVEVIAALILGGDWA